MAKSYFTSTCPACGLVCKGSASGYNRADADSRALWMSQQTRECDACYQTSRVAAAREAENRAGAESNLAAGLPVLQGTAKQVAWAESIRAKALARPANAVRKLPAATQAKADKLGITLDDLAARYREVHDACVVARDQLESEAAATWWIDNRSKVDSWVFSAWYAAGERASADLQARAAAEKAERAAAEKAEWAAREAREKAARAAEYAEGVVKARTFRVGSRTGAVVLEGTTLKIASRDGRTALGFVDGASWAVYRIGEHELSSQHPEMERIAAEARAVWEASGAESVR